MKYIILIALLVVCAIGVVSLIRNIKNIVDKKKLSKSDNNNDTDILEKKEVQDGCSEHNND